MRHLVVEEPDGTVRIAFNELIPAPELQEMDLTVNDSTDTPRDYYIKITHHEVVINVWNALYLITLFKFYYRFFRVIDLVDVLFTTITISSVHSESDVMLIPILLHAFYATTAGLALLHFKLWWETIFQCICTICLWITMGTYKMSAISRIN